MRTPLKQALAGAVFSAAVGMAPTANALQYNFDFNSTGPSLDFDLVLNVDTLDGHCPTPLGCAITAVTGMSPQWGNVSGLLPTGTFPGYNDNLFFSPPAPYVDAWGFSFEISPFRIHIFFANSEYYRADIFDLVPYRVIYGANGTVSVSPVVPEPETYAMLLAGLGLLGLFARRRQHRPAR